LAFAEIVIPFVAVTAIVMVASLTIRQSQSTIQEGMLDFDGIRSTGKVIGPIAELSGSGTHLGSGRVAAFNRNHWHLQTGIGSPFGPEYATRRGTIFGYPD